mgnify:CR=1 FL=1
MTILADAPPALAEAGDPDAAEQALVPDIEADRERGDLLEDAHALECVTITISPMTLYVKIDLPPASKRGGVSIVVPVTRRGVRKATRSWPGIGRRRPEMPEYDLLLLHYNTPGTKYLSVEKETISHE